MQIEANMNSSGAVICKTVVDCRKYRAKYKGCDKREAKKRFRAYVAAAEEKIMDEKRKAAINICLTCSIPADKCKGNCEAVRAALANLKTKRGKCIR